MTSTTKPRRAILVIDDDDDLREFVSIEIELMGFEPLEAATCANGLDLLAQHHDRIELVLLDYFMPGMDPERCARRVCDAAKPARVVLCTAAVDARGLARALGIGAWLAKPFDIADLRRAIDTRSRAAA